jgi:hypothetical protein
MQNVGCVFDENTIGVWFISCDTGDYMAALFRENGELRMRGRVRTYVDDKAFGSQDRKRWFQTDPPSVEAAIEATRKMLVSMRQMFALFGGVKDDAELLRGENESFEDFMGRFMVQTWAHAQPATEGENQRVH